MEFSSSRIGEKIRQDAVVIVEIFIEAIQSER